MQFNMDIPDQHAQRVVNAIAQNFGYQEVVPDPENPTGPAIPNPESKAAFAKRQVKIWMKQQVSLWESREATVAAQQRVDQEIQL
jgi:hypothetical protein